LIAMDNKTKPIVFTILLLTVGILFSIQFVDRPLALTLDGHLKGTKLLLHQLVSGLEWITAFNVSKYLLGGLLLLAGVVLYLFPLTRGISGYFFFIGSTHLVSRLVAGTLKNVFLRSRPNEFIENNEVRDFFVEGGSSFPSGHVAHFFSLFIPLLFIISRGRFWIILIPSIVAIQRVLSNDHYLSDVLAGILIAYLFSLAFIKLFQRRTVWRSIEQ
jgi:membrane-associated phospholipid phosphatase